MIRKKDEMMQSSRTLSSTAHLCHSFKATAIVHSLTCETHLFGKCDVTCAATTFKKHENVSFLRNKGKGY